MLVLLFWLVSVLSDTRTASTAYAQIPITISFSILLCGISLFLCIYFFMTAPHCVALFSLEHTVDGVELTEICLFLTPKCLKMETSLGLERWLSS